MEHMHDELTDADLEFLRKFKEKEKKDQEGYKDREKSGPNEDDLRDLGEHEDFRGDAENTYDEGDDFRDVPHDGDYDAEKGYGDQGQGGEDGGENQSENQGESQSENGDGEDGSGGEGERSGQEGDGNEGDGDGDGEDRQDDAPKGGDQEGDGDGESEGDSEGDGDQDGDGESEGEDGEDGEGEGEGESENKNSDDDAGDKCDGECKESDGEGDPCPYCTEKKKRQQQQKDAEADEDQDSGPIAYDCKGDPIYVGTEITSTADGNQERPEEKRYFGVVQGLADGFSEWPMDQRMICVFRRDLEQGAFIVEGEPGVTGWGVRSDLAEILAEEEDDKDEDQKKQEQKHDHDQEQDDDQEQEQEEDDNEGEGEDREQKEMTKTQKDRFDNICKRVFKKTDQTFGETIEASNIGADMPGGVYDDEEIARCYEIRSRGVTYRVTISAERHT